MRSCRNPVRHRRRVSGASPPARDPARANPLSQRRPWFGSGRGRRGPLGGGGARVGMRVVVVGAGIAGLTAAWELLRNGGVDVTVLEAERRAGGMIVTEQVGEFIVDGGPDGFLAGEPELPALAKEFGIGDHIVSQEARGTALWTGTALEPIEEGRAAELLGIDASSAAVNAEFRSFTHGMGEPVAALARRLAGSLRVAQGVAGLVRKGSRWHVAITGGSAHDADGVVLALPAYSAGRLLEAVGVAGGPRGARRNRGHWWRAAVVASVLLESRAAALPSPSCGACRGGASSPQPAASPRDRRGGLRWRRRLGVRPLGA